MSDPYLSVLPYHGGATDIWRLPRRYLVNVGRVYTPSGEGRGGGGVRAENLESTPQKRCDDQFKGVGGPLSELYRAVCHVRMPPFPHKDRHGTERMEEHLTDQID